MDIKVLYEKLVAINKEISDLLIECAYKKNHNLEMVSYDKGNADECMLYEEFYSLFTHFDFIYSMITYLQKPIKDEGIIYLTKRGKYKLNKTSLNRNDVIEILVYSEDIRTYIWNPIFVREHKDLEGKKARIREK